MAALAPTYSRQQTDELLALYDPHLFSPRHSRRSVDEAGPGVRSGDITSADSQSPSVLPTANGQSRGYRRRTASIASSVRSYFAGRNIPSGAAAAGAGFGHSTGTLPTAGTLASTSSRPGSVRSCASRSQQLAPLLCLPSEILLHILDFAFPPAPHSRWTSPERNRLLCTLSLVHPIMRAWAQFELFGGAPVHVTTDLAIERLSALANAPNSRGHSLVARISHLKVYGRHDTGDGGKALARLVHQLPGLEELHLEDLDGLELRAFVLHAPLRKLTITRCGFRSRFRIVAAARPSHLETLSLTRCTGHHDSFSGFSLPHLKDLTVWSLSLPPPSPLATLEGTEAFRLLANQVAPQLSAATVDEQHFHYLFPLALCGGSGTAPRSKLEQLTLVRLGHLPTVLEQLRFCPPASSTRVTSVKKLHLVPTPSFMPGATSPERANTHFQALLAPFQFMPAGESRPVGLVGVETIVLDWRYGAWLAVVDLESEKPSAESAKLADFVARCELAGIHVVVNEAPGPSAAATAVEFYGSMMGTRRTSCPLWMAGPSGSMGLTRTRSD